MSVHAVNRRNVCAASVIHHQRLAVLIDDFADTRAITAAANCANLWLKPVGGAGLRPFSEAGPPCRRRLLYFHRRHGVERIVLIRGGGFFDQHLDAQHLARKRHGRIEVMDHADTALIPRALRHTWVPPQSQRKELVQVPNRDAAAAVLVAPTPNTVRALPPIT